MVWSRASEATSALEPHLAHRSASLLFRSHAEPDRSKVRPFVFHPGLIFMHDSPLGVRLVESGNGLRHFRILPELAFHNDFAHLLIFLPGGSDQVPHLYAATVVRCQESAG